MSPHSSSARTRRILSLANVALGLTGVSLIVASLLPAQQASAADSDTGWGPQGTLTSESAQTVRWDNAGNTAESTVPRSQAQALPHTDGKTYNNVDRTIRDTYKARFGADNGLGGLAVTVSQTRDLVNQSVTVDISGAAGGTGLSSPTGTFFSVMQCWGALGADGKPDPAATSPDPATCVTGADVALPKPNISGRDIAGDPLVRGGDWASVSQAPFLTVSGDSETQTGNGWPSFSAASTNERTWVRADETGRAYTQFELQTGAESSGLGCAFRPDAASTSSCWLVVVPRLPFDGVPDNHMSALAPSIWAQRLQIELGFRDVFTACPSGQSAVLINGSEALRQSVASWLPGICSSKKLTLGYSVTGDELARNQFGAHAVKAVLTTAPTSGSQQTAFVPVAVTAPVIAYLIDYQPGCRIGSGLDIADVAKATGAQGDTDARACGYESLSALTADYAKSGTPVSGLRLSARLVAKLLTQFYTQPFVVSPYVGVPIGGGRAVVGAITADPEFQALNPALDHMDGVKGGTGASTLARLTVENTRTDEAAALWSWILADQAASEFLSGCPDDYGHTVNPFYSTRTYTGCSAQKSTLAAQAARERASVSAPNGYIDGALSYPPDGSPYPQPNYYEVPASGSGTNAVAALTFSDAFPAYTYAQDSGYQVAWKGYPSPSWCNATTTQDQSCLPLPGKWKRDDPRATPGDRRIMGITDAATAAKFQTPTALLCDSDGVACVGADTATLTRAASSFTKDARSGTLQAPTGVDAYYAAGAYPLTMPVYAAIDLGSTTRSERAEYGKALDYIVHDGQRRGLEAGELPGGYAPLTRSLTALAEQGLAQLAAGPTASPTPSASPEPTETESADPPPTVPDPPAAVPPAPVDQAPAPTGGSPSQSSTPVAQAPLGATAVGSAAPENSWPAVGLPTGVVFAAASGVFAPFLRRRNAIVFEKASAR